MTEALTPAWTRLRPHAKQQEMWRAFVLEDLVRFLVILAGRRSGKTVNAKRIFVARMLAFCAYPDGKFVCCAPVRDQAKELYWEDLKRLIPDWAIAPRGIRESDLSIRLVTGARAMVVGMDKPARVEGTAIDGAILDEFQDMKPEAWTRSLRPSLSTVDRPGWAIFLGKAKGQDSPLWKLFTEAKKLEDWLALTWPSSDILSPEEIAAAKRDLDEISFKREYDAQSIDFEGRAYYSYESIVHDEPGLRKRFYDPRQPLQFCHDFNVAPGVAAVAQEIVHPVHGECTACIGEVWIPRNSNSERVARKLALDWGAHEGVVELDGDATGGAKGSAKVAGSDWDLIDGILRPMFGGRLRSNVPKVNPSERVRINAVNSRLRTADGKIHMLVDPEYAPHVAEDLAGVSLLEGGSGELDKPPGSERTHISDALGYYLERRAASDRNKLTVTAW